MIRLLCWMLLTGIVLTVIAVIGLLILPAIIGGIGIIAGIIALIVAFTVMFGLFLLFL